MAKRVFVDTLADAGSRTWDRTMYLLGFDEAAKEKTRQQELERAMAARSESHLLDEVDLALLKEDAPPLENPGLAAADDAAGSPSWSGMAADGEETVGDLALEERSSTSDAPVARRPVGSQPLGRCNHPRWRGTSSRTRRQCAGRR